MARVCWRFQLSSARAALPPFLKLLSLQWPKLKWTHSSWAYFSFLNSYFLQPPFLKPPQQLCGPLGHRAPCSGTLSWESPRTTWGAACRGVAQPDCAPGHTCSKHSLFPRPSSSLCTDPLTHGKQRLGLMQSSSPLSRNPHLGGSFTPQAGTRASPQDGYTHARPAWESSFKAGGLFSENLFPWSPEKQEMLTKAGVGN